MFIMHYDQYSKIQLIRICYKLRTKFNNARVSYMNLRGDCMNKRDIIYEELKKIAEEHSICFDNQYIHLGQGMDCGELCVEYNDKEGYILFAN